MSLSAEYTLHVTSGNVSAQIALSASFIYLFFLPLFRSAAIKRVARQFLLLPVISTYFYLFQLCEEALLFVLIDEQSMVLPLEDTPYHHPTRHHLIIHFLFYNYLQP